MFIILSYFQSLKENSIVLDFTAGTMASITKISAVKGVWHLKVWKKKIANSNEVTDHSRFQEKCIFLTAVLKTQKHLYI